MKCPKCGATHYRETVSAPSDQFMCLECGTTLSSPSFSAVAPTPFRLTLRTLPHVYRGDFFLLSLDGSDGYEFYSVHDNYLDCIPENCHDREILISPYGHSAVRITFRDNGPEQD